MIYAIAVVLVLIADQAVKYWTTSNIVLGAVGPDCVRLIDGVVHMTNVHNYGAAFGIFQNARWPLTIISLVFVVAIIALINREIIHTRFGRWTAVLIVAGALGNCIDRLLYGYVVDMFEVEFLHFAVFNVADIFITVCGILFCIHLILHNEPEAVKQANEPEFMRRIREEKEAKEAPFANIPHRGEHVSLEDELRGGDEENPFSDDLEFGALLDDLIDARRTREREADFDAAPESGPAKEPSYEEEARRLFASEDEPGQKPEPDAGERRTGLKFDDYSLDDILSEFGDL